MYKLASRLKLTFSSKVGHITVSQLWDLSLVDLDEMAVTLQEEYSKSKGKTFLTTKSKKDKTIKLKFDIVHDILSTKIQERDEESNNLADKAHNQKILGLIAQKENEELSKMSPKELEKLLK